MCFRVAANFLGALWGAGNTLLPLAAAAAHGSSAQEGFIVVLLRSSAPSLIAALVLLLWGTRLLASVADRVQ